MERVGLVVPVLSNFKGCVDMFRSVDISIEPYVVPNWDERNSVAHSWNRGVKWAIKSGMDYLVIINDDVVLAPGALTRLIKASRSGFDLVSGANHDSDSSEVAEGVFPDYSCFVIKPHFFRHRFGEFDENFKPAYFEDNDMHYRLELAGALYGVHEGARIYHKGSVTQNMDGQRVVSHEQFEANRAYYTSKWGGWPREEKFVTPFDSGDDIHTWRTS